MVEFGSGLEGSDREDQDTWGTDFLAEGTASTKVLRQVYACCVKDCCVQGSVSGVGWKGGAY